MKLSQDEIYTRLVPALCPLYEPACKVFAERCKGARTVIDLGIGGGNIAHAILSSSPDLYYFGYDIDNKALMYASDKLSGFKCEFACADLESLSLFPADVIVSSLAIHHLSHSSQKDLFRRIHDAGKSFLHFELLAPDSDEQSDQFTEAMNTQIEVASNTTGMSMSDIWSILEKSKMSDNPMTLDQHIQAHKDCGADVDVLLERDCFVLYQASTLL